MRKALDEVLSSVEDLSSNTKAEIKELADSLDVTVSMASTKAKMISTLTSSSAYFTREEGRKQALFIDKIAEVEKELVRLRSENV